MLIPVVVILGLFLFGSNALADSIVLKDGQVIEGKIVFSDANKVEINNIGIIITYWADEIESVRMSGEKTTGFIGSTKGPENLAKADVMNLTAREEVALTSSLFSEKELIGFMRAFSDGWKAGEAGDLLQKHKGDLAIFKNKYLQEFKAGNRSVDSKGEGGAAKAERQMDQDLAVLLLAEIEQTMVSGGSKDALHTDVLALCNYLARLDESPMQDIYHNELPRIILNRLFFLLQQAVSEDWFQDNSILQRFVTAIRSFNFSFYRFDRRDFYVEKLKEGLHQIEKDYRDGKPLGEVMRMLDASAVNIPWQEAIVDDDFWKNVYKEFNNGINDMYPLVDRVESRLRFSALKGQIDVKISDVESRVSREKAGDGQKRIVKAVGDVFLISEFRKMRRQILEARFISCQIKTAYVGLVVKLFELKNGRAPELLSDLIPQYGGKRLVDDDFGRDLVYRRSPIGMVICSFGPDGRDDEGSTRVTFQNVINGDLNGDVCFSFK